MENKRRNEAGSYLQRTSTEGLGSRTYSRGTELSQTVFDRNGAIRAVLEEDSSVIYMTVHYMRL